MPAARSSGGGGATASHHAALPLPERTVQRCALGARRSGGLAAAVLLLLRLAQRRGCWSRVPGAQRAAAAAAAVATLGAALAARPRARPYCSPRRPARACSAGCRNQCASSLELEPPCSADLAAGALPATLWRSVTDWCAWAAERWSRASRAREACTQGSGPTKCAAPAC